MRLPCRKVGRHHRRLIPQLFESPEVVPGPGLHHSEVQNSMKDDFHC